MKIAPVDVQRLVDACADAAQLRVKADAMNNSTNEMQYRVQALECIVEVLADLMLKGTTADPADDTEPEKSFRQHVAEAVASLLQNKGA